MPALWVPTVLFAHAFATFWLIKTLLLNDPRALSFLWRRRKPVSHDVLHARALQKAHEAALADAGDVGAAADVILHVPKKSSGGGALHASGAREARAGWGRRWLPRGHACRPVQ